jgi:methionyl-tRNA formyltransferase
MKKVCILTSRPIGERCIAWAQENTPSGLKVINEPQLADIVISVMYEKIIPQKYTENKKCFNFHPGTLPEYRGSGTFSWVLINQERKAGVTLHIMDKGIDTGAIIEIREILISKEDTAYSLFLRGEELIYKMFKDWYEDLLNNAYVAIPQILNSGKFYYKKDLQKAKNLTRYIKAFYFPGKEGAYYYNESTEKIYIDYKKKLK